MSAASLSERSRAEAERQLGWVERPRAAVASMHEPGRRDTGQDVAVRPVGRADLGAPARKRAPEAGVLVELSGSEADLVRERLERAVPEVEVVQTSWRRRRPRLCLAGNGAQLALAGVAPGQRAPGTVEGRGS